MLIFLKSKKKKPVVGNMPGSSTATRQDRGKKAGTRPAAPVLFTINEEDEQQKNGNSKKEKAPDGPHGKVQEKKMSLSRARKDNALSKSEPHLTLKVDERQRLARERRVEREKLMAARESLWLEKEVRARQHYVKHLEQRKKKLEEQRVKEEKRRAAVDEKRRQRLEEEKERHEAVVKRTMERSQKPKQKINRWSWGGTLQSNTSVSSSDPERRSVSTMNLSKHIDPVINKRLSTSSATLLNTPDRGRRPLLSPWESTVVSRLLTPTHSYLARSKSTAALSGDAASCSPISSQFSKTPYNKSSEKAKHFFTTPEEIARRRTIHLGGTSSVEKKEKRDPDRENVLTPISIIKRAISPSAPKPKSPAATSRGPSHKSSSLRSIPATVNSLIKMATTPQRPLSPGNVRPVKKDSKEDSKKKKDNMPPNPTERQSIEEKGPPAAPPEGPEGNPSTPSPVITETMQEPISLAPAPVQTSPAVTSKPFAGTTDPGEATRILAEKRKLAREQREREEEEKREREEEERRKNEEMAQRQTLERARREEEAKQQEAERIEQEEKERQEKEMLQKQQAEEKEQREREEAERLQKQKEEDDRLRVEREKHFQKEEQERSERKKRLEEIMKRTRRNETGDKQPNVQKNGEVPKLVENTTITPNPLNVEQTSFLQSNSDAPQNGESVESVAPSARIVSFSQALPEDSTEKQPNENGLRTSNNNFEEIINLPVGSKPMKRDSLNNEGNRIEDLPPLNPLIAFEVDNVQTPQTAEVI
ncbi:ensconsin isoform X3 [Eleutherodactylus coqui]|uniref:ensconsin isoform X3 n=1 Tax=Eleutherodactylus coqui TaxID=57060 RepID=UPI0034622909